MMGKQMQTAVGAAHNFQPQAKKIAKTRASGSNEGSEDSTVDRVKTKGAGARDGNGPPVVDAPAVSVHRNPNATAQFVQFAQNTTSSCRRRSDPRSWSWRRRGVERRAESCVATREL